MMKVTSSKSQIQITETSRLLLAGEQCRLFLCLLYLLYLLIHPAQLFRDN
jgi:hypothetical protein